LRQQYPPPFVVWMKTQSVFIHAPNFYLSIWILSREEVGPGLKFFFQFSGSIGSASRSDCRVTRRRKIICFRYSHPRRPSILCPVPAAQPICNLTTIPQSSIWCFVPKDLPSRAGPVVRLLTMIMKPKQDAVEIPPSCTLPVVTFDELINPDSPITCYLRYLQSRQTCCQQPNSLLMTQFHWRRSKTVTGKQFFDT